MYFKNRREAGDLLAEKLKKYLNKDVIVYCLPRGGVLTAYEIAKKLNAPLDLVITRKIGHPSQPEYAIAALAENGDIIKGNIDFSSIDKTWFKKEVEKEKEEAKRRREKYLSGQKMVSPKGKIAILVDDGIATGLTIRAGILELKHQNPKKLVVAVPVAPRDVTDQIKSEVDEFIVLDIPAVYIGAVGAYFEDFHPVSDEEVINFLKEARSFIGGMKYA